MLPLFVVRHGWDKDDSLQVYTALKYTYECHIHTPSVHVSHQRSCSDFCIFMYVFMYVLQQAMCIGLQPTATLQGGQLKSLFVVSVS